jgi:hypothetical protein
MKTSLQGRNLKLLILPVLLLLISLTAILNIIFLSNHKQSTTFNDGPDTLSRSHNVLHQEVTSCSSHNTNNLKKITKSKGIACPIFRDEEGFLAEFIAYYQLHGLDHIKLYDDGSTDNSLQEIQPWITSGFVSIESNISGLFQDALAAEEITETWEWYAKVLERGERIAMQFFAHNHCKEYAIANQYDFMFTLDIDEYIVPNNPGITVMDAVDHHARNTSDFIFSAPRVNFASTPHILEPIDLLTIEAYKYRMAVYGQMSFFRKVQPKIYFYLKRPVKPEFEIFIKECCDIHTCSLNCSTTQPREVLEYANTAIHNSTSTPVSIFHYARSLEKYDMKRKTWSQYNNMAYSLSEFLDRNLGRSLDVRASRRYGCEVREILQTMTGEDIFLRPGNFWYRNVEYNRSLLDEGKVLFGDMTRKNITDFSVYSGWWYRSLVDNVDMKRIQGSGR